ncbi:MAG: hypothetical protein JEZ00_20090 [Anaerolineaceae bacterium]|nr:hypothetical protein [Anaerolineaceae bacterium]
MKKIKFYFIMLLLILDISGCSQSSNNLETNNLQVNTISLKEYSDILQGKAEDWDSEAYLDNVDMYVYSNTNNGNDRYLDAFYFSKNKSKESLWIKINRDGTITSTTINQQERISHNEQIVIDENLIDSIDAFGKLSDDRILRSIMNDRRARLSLTYKTINNQRRLVWILTKDFDSNLYYESFYLDAYSEEILLLD